MKKIPRTTIKVVPSDCDECELSLVDPKYRELYECPPVHLPHMNYTVRMMKCKYFKEKNK